jgi:hypothetical protein
LTTSQGLAGSVSEYCLGRLEAADGGAGAALAGEVAGDADDGGADAGPEGDADGEPDAARADPDPVAEAGAVRAVAEDAGRGPSGVHAASADSPAPAASSLAIDRRLGGRGGASGEQS